MIPPEELLQHADFLRALSRRLVRDEHRADDLVQSTWVRALESPPPLRDRLRGWLGVVARNVLRKEQRSDQRRRHREQEVARRHEPSFDRSEDSALLHAVVDAVGRLSGEQRQVVLMRFYQGLPPREIARQLQLPVETVRSRTKRALANLRQDLDRREGGRDEWVRGLSILTGLEAPAATASPVPKTAVALKVGAAVLLLVVGFVVFEFLTFTDYEWVNWNTRNGHALGFRERSLFEKERVEHFFEAFTSIGDESPSATPAEASPSRREAKVTGDIHHGVVVDSDGEPIFGARVEVFARRPDDSLEKVGRVATDPKGRFATDRLPLGDYHLVASGSGYATTSRDLAESGETRLTLRAGGWIAGRLIDANTGAWLEKVQVHLNLPDARGDAGLEQCLSDEQGRFRFSGIPIGTPIRLHFRSDDHAPTHRDLQIESVPGLEIEVALREGD